MLRRAGRSIRVAWLAIGAALVLVLALESAYRGQAWLRQSIGAWRASKHLPSHMAAKTWYAQVIAEGLSATSGWRPYVYYRRLPYKGRYVTVDSLGRRWTPQAAPEGAAREVLMFGGSPLWGTGLPDSMTIPARVAGELTGHGVRNAVVTNFGESGYVFTQEVIELLLQLRAGARPAAVVFYDGYNDVSSALENGYAGVTKTERDRPRDSDLGRALFPWRTDLATESRVALELGRIAVGRLRFVSRFRSEHPVSAPPNDSLADEVVRTYVATADEVEALAQDYGFEVLYVWMPLLDPAEKHLSPFEHQVADATEHDPAGHRFLELHRLVTRRLAAAMHSAAPGRFIEISPMFAADSAAVYVDDLGHTTEVAAAAIGADLAQLLTPMIAGASRHSGRGAAATRGR